MRTLGIVALATLAACAPAPPDPRGVAHDEVLLQISATGQVDSAPSEARFSAGLSSIAATGPEAAAANDRKMNAVIAALTAQGIARADLQTRQVGLNRLDYGPNRGRFEATNIVAVRVRQADRAGAAISVATGAGANIVSGPDLRQGDAEAASRGAYAAAYRNARARADAYAEAAGMRVARTLVIRDTPAGRGPEPAYDMARIVAPAPVVAQSAPVLAGTDTLAARVDVTFALAAK